MCVSFPFCSGFSEVVSRDWFRWLMRVILVHLEGLKQFFGASCLFGKLAVINGLMLWG